MGSTISCVALTTLGGASSTLPMRLCGARGVGQHCLKLLINASSIFAGIYELSMVISGRLQWLFSFCARGGAPELDISME
jgi:hypothetical protein